ncbi:GxxExxY protein [Spirosoma fluviale]|uniref:GxxExxY protein n=1 Tax=Spirosoma fluviale TaxID=1597977 RepID=A0A286GLA1_9BACT|nr:GxxExxY protein [Spirosoma fluviale]SOD96315.1 GxxExxY protein [Spirosoma fluviale]
MYLLQKDLTEVIIKSYYQVYNTLGFGFLEKVYENALLMELRNRGYKAIGQQQIKVYYHGVEVGNYFADLIVNDAVIIELKAAETIIAEHEQQLLNYLKATQIEVGLLLNFGKKPEFRRRVFENQFKSVPSV